MISVFRELLFFLETHIHCIVTSDGSRKME